MPPEPLLSLGAQPKGHQRAAIGRVDLADLDELHAAADQIVGHPGQRAFVRRRQDHGERPGGQVARATLSGGVDDLGGLSTARQVRSNHDVMGERALVDRNDCVRGVA